MKVCIFILLLLKVISIKLKLEIANITPTISYLVKGNGDLPEKGSALTVHYTGTFKDGIKFDSSKDSGSPFTFKLGEGQVISCWDQAVAKLKVGDTVRVECPSQIAYGSQGPGEAIPPNTDLNFEIEMLSFK
jgi:FKBP-type peptidyl-prolyl cis-trans isomerase